LVPAPTWSAIEAALSRELEHLERHVEEGDDDPVEATYAICYGSRILYAIETGDVAISKRAGGMWALEHVDAGIASEICCGVGLFVPGISSNLSGYTSSHPLIAGHPSQASSARTRRICNGFSPTPSC
jgi:hypothetical protein